tara:strand:+ start:978 stop:1178 length:201 start_codon:yes stop_codon:yes gene_type:complete
MKKSYNRYKFVKVTFSGEEDAVKTLIKMYFGNIHYELTKKETYIAVDLRVPVSFEEIQAESNEGAI